MTKFTDPAWTSAIAKAGAIVTEVGGTLSHAAIVSRELGVPAVLNVQGATTKLVHGQMVRIDGDRGLIHLQDKAPSH